MIQNGKKYLITLDNWFYAPDGNQYTAIYGIVNIKTTKDAMGFNPTHSTNWFAEVGQGDKTVLIAGCRIHYAVATEQKPVIKMLTHDTFGKPFEVPNIYIVE